MKDNYSLIKSNTMEKLNERKLLAIEEFFSSFSVDETKEILDDLMYQWMISQMASDEKERGDRLFLTKQLMELLCALEPLEEKRARHEEEFAGLN